VPWGSIFKNGCSVFRLGCGRNPGAELAQRPGPAEPHGSPRSEILFNIDFLDEAHGRSNRSVACLNGARLERSLVS
jgi:hypothetical protein